MPLACYLANTAWQASNYFGWRRFRKASQNLAETQRDYLLQLLQRHRDTEYGQKYGFASIRSPRAFQERLPITDYSAYEVAVRKIRRGAENILTIDPVSRLEPTSGTTSGTRLIPYSSTLRDEFQRGISPWIYNLYDHYPSLKGGSAYWAVSPHQQSLSEVGDIIPIGFAEDAEYLGGVEKWLVQQIMAVPAQVGGILDMDTFRYTVLRFLLARGDLRLISVWNPSYLYLLLEPLRDWWPLLLADLRNGGISFPQPPPDSLAKMLSTLALPQKRRADELAALDVANGDGWCEQIWPELTLISCWGDAWAAQTLPVLQSLFPSVVIQPKGLLATEAFVTFPLISENQLLGHVLSPKSHFFEFEDLQGGELQLAHELEIGKNYAVIVTTGGGLYRYRLNDRVEVCGYYRQLPLLKFLGKVAGVSDLFGEKLGEDHLRRIIASAFKIYVIDESAFYFIAAEEREGGVGYTLFYSGDLNGQAYQLAEHVEAELGSNFHYRHCRNLGQLLSFRVHQVSARAEDNYLRYKANGAHLTTVKRRLLETGKPTADWIQILN